VVIHPGSGSAAKCWPIDNFAALIETLETQLSVRTVIVTGYADTAIGASLRALIHTAKPLVAENWPLLPTASLIGQAAVFVGHDSGLTHLAAALGRPTVAIFGPTDSEVWGPRGDHVTVLPMMTTLAGGEGKRLAWGRRQDTAGELRQVLEAVQSWLVRQRPRHSPSDQPGRL
jgi:ADP-heptose:LPS heptosyltransferase